MFLIATASCVLVILSLVHFLMALSANYAHIRGHDKFTDLVVSKNHYAMHYHIENKFKLNQTFFIRIFTTLM